MQPLDFSSPPDAFIPPPEQWPVFDSVLMCTFSPESSPSPSTKQDPLPCAAALAAMPIPPSRSSSRNKNPDHIPRPRNAFMLFRSAFAAAQKISSTIEHDNRHITRIIAHCWHRLSDADKQVWHDKAAAEKAQHAQRYPNYRFSPVGRANKPVKRNVRRNGVEDVKRCEKLAELVMAGKFGKDLEHAIKEIDDDRLAAAHVVDASTSVETCATDNATTDSEPSDVPPFRSPLLPPATIPTPEETLMSQIIPIEPPGSYSPTDPSLDSLFKRPNYQPYQPDMRHGAKCVLPLDQFHSVMNLVRHSYGELEQQCVPDNSLFLWNPSDNFSYYQ